MTRPHTPRVEEQLALYTLDALEGQDLRELKDHLATGCSECRRRLADWESVLVEVAETVPPVAPSELTRARLLKLVDGEGKRPRSSWPAWTAAAAAFVLLIWSGWTQLDLRWELDRLAAERQGMARRMATLEEELETARAEGHRLARTLALMASPETRTVVLAGLPAAPGAAARAFVNPREGRGVFYAFNLQPLGTDRTYQLWAIVEGTPVSAGIFDVDAQGQGSLQMEGVPPLEEIQAWAVTVEPQGGVPQPTGQMVLKS